MNTAERREKMKNLCRSSKKQNTIIWFVAVLLVSFLLSSVIKYIYQNYSSRAMADTGTEAGIAETEDGLKYQQISVSPEGGEDALITLDGMMPVSAEVTVESEEKSPSDTLCAYDITITDTVGNSFQPESDSPITVEITNSIIGECDETSLHLWHIDEAGIREEVTGFTIQGNSVIFAATGFSLYEISQGEPELCTYVFYTPDSNGDYKKYYYMTTTGKQICEQIIKDSDSLMMPQLPANAESKTFIGWYILDGTEGSFSVTETEVDFEEPQGFTSGGTVNIGAVYADCVYLIFHDQYNDTIGSYPIVGTRRGIVDDGTATISLDGIEVSYDDDADATHMVFAGWTLGSASSPNGVAAGQNAPENASLVGDENNNYSVSVNTHLYPVFRESAWLTFSTGGIAEGAQSIQMQIIGVDEAVTDLPVPVRTGYAFAGWYADEEKTSKQISDSDGNIISNASLSGTKMEWRNGSLYLTGDTKLYAKWTPAQADYTVVIWRQSVNDAANLPDSQKTYDYAESHEITSVTGYYANVPAADKTKSGNDYTGFHYSRSDPDNTKTVAADGSTILNVYYDRNVHTLTFKNGNTTVKTITGLYGSYINNNFPIGGDYDCYWSADRTDIYAYILVTLETMPDSDVVFTKTAANSYGTIYYYVEIDESDAGEYSTTKRFSYNGEQLLYGLYKTAKHPFSFLTYNEEYHPIDGYYRDSALAEPFFGESGWYNNNNYRKTLNSPDSAPIGGHTNNRTTENNVNYMYYNRNTYTLEFYNSENNNLIATESIKYTQKTESFLPDPPDPPAGKQFSGWYADPGCTVKVFFHEPSQEEIDSTNDENGVPHYQVYDRMPSHNLVVYAGWEKLWYLVEIDPNGGEFGLQSGGNDNSGYSTWFWVNYGDLISEYTEVTRDYEISQDGTYFYKYCDRDYYELTEEYEDREDGYTDRSAGYTEDFREATDRVHRYEPAVGAYRYAGWYRVDKQTGAETPYSFDTPVTENVFLKLHWKAVGTYYIQYNPGEGELDNNDTNEEEFQTLDTADYADKARIVIMRTVVKAPEGMNFIGWRLRNDPTGTIYYPGGAFEFDAENAETSVDEHGNERKYMVLDAVYQAIDEPSLIYDANGGTMTSNADHGSGTFLKNVSYNENTGAYTETPLTDAEKYQYNVDAGRLTVRNLENNTVVTLSNGTGFSYTYNGVTFDFYGWNTEPDGSGTRYEPGSHLYIDTTGNNPVTLYAMWKTRVYFDKNKNNSTWGGSWSEYEYDAQKDQYYKEIYLNSTIDEPPYYPAAADAIFYNWSTVKYETAEGSVPFDFSQPITQSIISSESEGTYLTLYAIWDKLPEIRVHAVDSSRKILEDKDAEWVKEEYITVGGTHIPLTAYSDVNAYADPLEENLTDYQFAFACVSNSLEKVSEEKRITDIYYNAPERHVYVTYADGTAAPLSDDEEIYLIYYNTRLPVGYVAIDTDGSISTVTVDNSAPTSVSAAGTSYNMSSDVTAPIAWANSAGNSYSFYSFAIGDVMPETPDSSALNYITTAKNSDSSRPNLYVRATWRGFEYSLNGTTWRSAGYEPELYAIYYTIEPSIVNLHEITNGLPEDMDTEFEYNVTITRNANTTIEKKYYILDGNTYIHLPDSSHIYSRKFITYKVDVSLIDETLVNDDDISIENTTINLSDEQTEAFTLFYRQNETNDSWNVAQSGSYTALYYRDGLFDYCQIYWRNETTETVTQSIEIVQTPKAEFSTTMSQSPANGTINLSALTYNYTATSTPRTQDITYTNTRNNTPVEVHVAVAKGGGYYEHDELRTSDESVYSKTIGSLDLQSEIQPFDLFDSADEEQYGFAGIIYGKKLDGYANNRIETEGSGITSVTYGQIDGNVYDIYLNNDTDMLLDDNEIYYVYYKKPVIVYCSEGANGTLTRIDPLTLHGAAIPQLNGQDVVQEGVLPLNGTDELVISQTIRNAFIVPPILDYAGSDVPVEYAIIGVGSPDASRLDDLQYSEDMELRLSVDEGGIVRYRFNGTDTAVPLPTADDLVVYAIYKGGNKLTISKTINRASTKVGYPTFQFSVKRIKDENGTVLDPATEEERIVSLTFTSSGTMTTELAKLPLGTYEVTELSNINYTLSDVNVSPAEETAPEGVTATVTMESRSEKTVSFVNSLNSNEKKTYQTFEGNHIVHSDQ